MQLYCLLDLTSYYHLEFLAFYHLYHIYYLLEAIQDY
nr:MAG TPA: hypothetical protein [Caudoviricetes sp.]